MSLQNLKEQHLYSLLPDGVVSMDEKGLIAAVIGGVQDRVEDIRSYAKKYELFFTTSSVAPSNVVVLVTFETDYGKVVTRSLDIDTTTPTEEGDGLTSWSAEQMDVSVDSITSCVFGEDLLRYVDINTLQYIAANVGAVLYTTAAQSGSVEINQQRILDSYFPRLKIKGTVQSFDVLGRLLGFDDIRIVPLWGRLSPRLPSDFGSPVNDADFAHSPVYAPQQNIGVAYDPMAMRDGPFFSWSGTVVSDQTSTSFYSQVINGMQPWVKVSITGSVVHPSVDEVVTLSGGGPHTKASATPGYGLRFEALGEGDSFNGLEIRFAGLNDGTDRIVSITDRLSALKYRTSYFDIIATVDDVRAIAQFGTVAAKKNTDLSNNPYLTNDGVASAPYRPWYSGSAVVPIVYSDYTYKVQEGTSTPVVGDGRFQATSAQTQHNVSPLQKTAVQLVQAIDEVRPATRLTRRVGIGYLTTDKADYAAYLESTSLGTLDWNGLLSGVAENYVESPYDVEIVVNGTLLSAEVLSGTVVAFGDGAAVSGTYNLFNHSFEFAGLPVGAPVVAQWIPTSSEVVRSYPGSLALEGYQARPEDYVETITQGTHPVGTYVPYETADEYPWRESVVNGGALIEVTAHPTPTVDDISVLDVQNSVAVKGHDGVDYNVYCVSSTSLPLRTISEPKDITNYQPGQLPIGYSGGFVSLDSITSAQWNLPGNRLDDFRIFFVPDSKLYHVGLAQGVLVADLPGFFAPHMRDGLVGWLPLNEHPDVGDVAFDVSSSNTTQKVTGFTLTGSFADKVWDAERGWVLYVSRNGTVHTQDHREIGDEYTLSFWMKPDAIQTTYGTVATSGTLPIIQHGPVRVELPNDRNTVALYVLNSVGTHFHVADLSITPGVFSNVVVGVAASVVRYGIAPLSGTLDFGIVNMGKLWQPFTETGDELIITSGTNRCYSLQDVRMWNTLKSVADLNRVHNYNPTPTIATYWPSTIQQVSTGDNYGLKVTSAGFVYPDKMPPAVRMNRLVRVQRYDSMGRYTGEPRYEEVGLGGGTLVDPSAQYLLGRAVNVFPATGTIVVSTSHGQLPGYNDLWFTATGSNLAYLRLPMSGSTSNGITGTITPYVPGAGEATYWPHQTDSTNPCQQRVWVVGDDRNLYEVTLASSGTAGAYLTGTRVLTAGNKTVMASQGITLTVGSGGLVYQSGTLNGSGTQTPPLYLYLNSRTKDDVEDATQTWTSQNDPNAFGNSLTPTVAALDANGVMEFENTSTLEPGYYRLSITSGNIGKVDSDFDGYSVEISVEDYLIIARLCQGETGSDFQKTDVLEFRLDQTISANWFLSVNWLNAYRNDARGVARKFAIYSYRLEKVQSDLYRVDINLSGTDPSVTLLDTWSYNQETPGGWMASMNSYGSISGWSHESKTYQSSDTVTAIVPLSSVFTGNTSERREDCYVLNGTAILSDGTIPPLPIFTSIVVT